MRVLIDGFGGGFVLSPSYHLLRRQGVPVARFLHSLLPWKMPYLDLRLHKKCLVIDGAVAFVGGLNIGAENLVASHPKSPVRDCHFRLEGTIVRQIQQQFDDDWLFTTREPTAGPATPDRFPSPARRRARSSPGRTRTPSGSYWRCFPPSRRRTSRSGSPRPTSCLTSNW